MKKLMTIKGKITTNKKIKYLKYRYDIDTKIKDIDIINYYVRWFDKHCSVRKDKNKNTSTIINHIDLINEINYYLDRKNKNTQ